MPELDPKILGKIRKCLALSASSNPNEAATALRQAHALMQKHGVTAEGITMSDIGESRVNSRTMARNKPELWEASLAGVVGKAFGCSLMINTFMPKKDSGVRTINRGSFVFVGLKAQSEVAAYTADVLIRRCKAARATWIRDKLGALSGRSGGKRLATRMGNEFAMGWVRRIAALVHDFAHPPEVEKAIKNYIAEHVNGDDESLVRDQKLEDDKLKSIAQDAGARAAANERLHRPVNGGAQQQMLGAS